MTQVNMKEVRTWWGGKKFVMDDTSTKPKTFSEIEADKIEAFMGVWFKFSLIPVGLVFLLYLWPWEWRDRLEFGYPGTAFFTALAIGWIINMPNLIFALMRLAALWFVTAGRE